MVGSRLIVRFLGMGSAGVNYGVDYSYCSDQKQWCLAASNGFAVSWLNGSVLGWGFQDCYAQSLCFVHFTACSWSVFEVVFFEKLEVCAGSLFYNCVLWSCLDACRGPRWSGKSTRSLEILKRRIMMIVCKGFFSMLEKVTHCTWLLIGHFRVPNVVPSCEADTCTQN